MLALKIIFWSSIFIIFYSYIGYGILVWIYIKLFGAYRPAYKKINSSFEPDVTLIIATYNEELIIRDKIENTLQLDYPSEKLKILIVADGSTDNTLTILNEYPGIETLYKPGRSGKVAAINRAMQFVSTPVVVFCDANTFLNPECIRRIVAHYEDPEVGAVAGEKKVIDTSGNSNAAGAGEGLYWKYESFLKKLDSSFYTVVGAAGELFSIRTELFEPADTGVLLDDFIISMKISAKGYRVIYEPGAYAAEAPSFNIREEQKRKIRISAGGFQSVLMLKPLLNIFRFGRLSFQYISHRVLRWIVCPVLLPLILICNVLIVYLQPSPVYNTILILQGIFYLAGAIGWIMASRNLKSRFFFIPYYFLFMNASLYIGFVRFMSDKQTVLWDKALRKN